MNYISLLSANSNLISGIARRSWHLTCYPCFDLTNPENIFIKPSQGEVNLTWNRLQEHLAWHILYPRRSLRWWSSGPPAVKCQLRSFIQIFTYLQSYQRSAAVSLTGVLARLRGADHPHGDVWGDVELVGCITGCGVEDLDAGLLEDVRLCPPVLSGPPARHRPVDSPEEAPLRKTDGRILCA